jgi:2-polyprenyl-3-methyl-5-hydroxy-6-metoxy-1,4-benzoquinol methylase
VADVGCGYGSPTIALASARPHARVDGFDAHDGSIARARRAAATAGVADRVRFEVATAKDFPIPDGGYDLVTLFDVLHDLGDPVGALAHVRAALAEGGTVMLVEPLGADRVEDNLNPVGRMWYGASVIACTPNALAQEGHALGTLAGEARLREVAAAAGFGRVRRVPVDAPLNLVLELRP